MSVTNHLIKVITSMEGGALVAKNVQKLEKNILGVGQAGVKMSRTMKVADGQFIKTTGVLDKTSGKVKILGSQFVQTGKSTVKAAGLMGQFQKALMRVAIVVPVWMAARAAIQAVTTTIRNSFRAMIDLTSGLARAQAVARGTADEIKAAMIVLKNESIEFARTNKGTEKDVTEAFYRMGTAGIDLKTSLAASVPVARLANATYADIVQTGKTVAGIYRVLGDSIKGASSGQEKMIRITDVLATAWSNHRIELNEVERALANVGAQTKRFGLSMEETMAIIAISSDNLIASGRAGRLFSRVLDDMVNKLPKVQRLLGKTFDKNVQIKWLDVLTEVLAKIKELGVGTIQSEEALAGIFGIRARRQAGIFLKDIEQVVNAMSRFKNESKGMAQSLINIRNATPEAQLEMLGNNVTVLVRNFATGVMGANSFVEALISLNTHLKEISENAIIAGTFIDQMGINIKAIPKLMGAWLGSLAAVTQEVVKGSITIEQADEIMLQTIDEALAGAKDLHEAEVEALVKFRQQVKDSITQMKLLKDIQAKISAATKKSPIVPTEGDMNRSLKVLKAYGASEIQIANERIKYLIDTLKYDEADTKVIDARIKLLEVEQALRRKNAKIIESISKAGFKTLFETGDVREAVETFRTGLRSSIIDAMSEGATNLMFEMSGLSDILGQGLQALKFETAIVSGATQAAPILSQAIVSGVQQSKAMGVGEGAPGGGINLTGGGDSKKKPGGGLLGGGGFDWGQMMGMGLMAWSILGGAKGGGTNISQKYGVAPEPREIAATTRMTTKAKITNIILNVNVDVGGMSIDEQKTINTISNKLGSSLKETVKRVLEEEDISSGNV